MVCWRGEGGWGDVGAFPADAQTERDAGEAYLSATFTQQSPWFAMIAAKGSPTGCEEYGLWFSFLFFFLFLHTRSGACEPCGAVRLQRLRSVSGQREQPSRAADAEVPHRGCSCLLRLLLLLLLLLRLLLLPRRRRRGAHVCGLARVCHIAELSSSLSLHPV